MADIKWIKVTTDIFDDEKIRLIEAMPEADSIIVIWFKLLTLAGRQNSDGILRMNKNMPYTDEMLSTLFRRPLNTVRLALATFEGFGMIEMVNDTIIIPNWEKHQNIDGMEKVREQTRERTRRYRERQKAKLLTCDVTCDATVTVCDGTEQEQEQDKELISSSRMGGSGNYTDIWKSLSVDEIDRLADLFEMSCDLIQAVYEDVKLKQRIVEHPYEYIIGYAKNKGWERANGENR